jgi:hypothetical protein
MAFEILEQPVIRGIWMRARMQPLLPREREFQLFKGNRVFLGACVLHLIVGPTSWHSELNYFIQAAAVWNIGTIGARSRWLAAIPSKCVRMLRSSAVTNVSTKREARLSQANNLFLIS